MKRLAHEGAAHPLTIDKHGRDGDGAEAPANPLARQQPGIPRAGVSETKVLTTDNAGQFAWNRIKQIEELDGRAGSELFRERNDQQVRESQPQEQPLLVRK